MPLLAGLIVTLFGSLFQWFLKYASTKIALAAAAITAFAGLTAALLAAGTVAMTTLQAVLPDMPGVLIGVWVAVPDQTAACISLYFASDAVVALYAWNVQNLKLAAYVT